jgi:hypothetical protein
VAKAWAQPARPQPHHRRQPHRSLSEHELKFHLGKALENGVTRDEIVEMVTHLAFYSGWPTASTALGIAREVFAAAPQKPAQSKGTSNADA